MVGILIDDGYLQAILLLTGEVNFMEKKMNKRIFSIVSLVMVFTGLVPSVYAENNGTRLDAHVHGLSELTIALEGESLDLQLTSPAMNIVGFEYKAASKKDIEAVKTAESILSQPEVLFLLSDKDCKPINIDVDISGLIEEDNHEQHDHKENDDHKDHHDHDKHKSHAEIVANYSYSCNDSSKLSSIKVSLFESFPGIETINAMWVMPSKQGSVRLSAKNSTIEFN